MALPANLTQVAVRWEPRDSATGAAATGTCTFTPKTIVNDVNGVSAGVGVSIFPVPKVVNFSSGIMSTVLTATDDPDGSPVNWTWECVYSIAGWASGSGTFNFSVPAATSGTLDLAGIVPTLASGGTSTSTGYTNVLDEGAAVTQRSTLNFVGTGVSVADVGGLTTVSVTSGGGGSGHTIQDEGASLTARTKLNFVGSGVAVTDGGSGPDSTIVTINTGAGSAAGTTFDPAPASPSMVSTNVEAAILEVNGTLPIIQAAAVLEAREGMVHATTWQPAYNGLIACNGDPGHALSSFNVNAGTHYVQRLFLPPGVITNYRVSLNTAGVTLTGCYFTLYDDTGALIANTRSADQATFLASAGNQGYNTPVIALGTAYNNPIGQFAYLTMSCATAATPFKLNGLTSGSIGNFGLAPGVTSATSPRWGTATNVYSGSTPPSTLGSVAVSASPFLVAVS